MELGEARELAAGLLVRHGLTGWRLTFDNAKTRAGVCRPVTKEIGLSRPLMRLYTVEQVTETVLHEIAHALVGAEHGHDKVWRATAQRIGCSGTRCVPEGVPRVEGSWVGFCPAGHRTTAHRRPTRVRSCSRCSRAFDRSAVFAWTYRGQAAPMQAAYAAEMVRVQGGRPGVAFKIGDRVRLKGGGKYGGLVGTIVKQGRSRYHVQTRAGLLNATFAMVEPVA